ncbi:MAG: hypothetical protein J6C40_07605, partial [Lentisphaeria bacterium]|nr:hypothetical protein [Lentisphaeria bacterium]
MTEYRFLRHASGGELRDLLALYREAQWVTQDECGAFLPGVLSGSFLFLAAFALVTALAGEYVLAFVEGLIVLGLLAYFRHSNDVRKREILSYI